MRFPFNGGCDELSTVPGTYPFLAPSRREPQRERPAQGGWAAICRTPWLFFPGFSPSQSLLKTLVNSKNNIDSRSLGFRATKKAVSVCPKNVSITIPAWLSFARRPSPTQHTGHGKQRGKDSQDTVGFHKGGVHDQLLALNRLAPMIPLEGKGENECRASSTYQTTKNVTSFI